MKHSPQGLQRKRWPPNSVVPNLVTITELTPRARHRYVFPRPQPSRPTPLREDPPKSHPIADEQDLPAPSFVRGAEHGTYLHPNTGLARRRRRQSDPRRSVRMARRDAAGASARRGNRWCRKSRLKSAWTWRRSTWTGALQSTLPASRGLPGRLAGDGRTSGWCSRRHSSARHPYGGCGGTACQEMLAISSPWTSELRCGPPTSEAGLPTTEAHRWLACSFARVTHA